MKFQKIKPLSIIAACMATNPTYSTGSNENVANKEICKKIRPTGTRSMKKTCMTQRGSDEIKKRGQYAARTSQRLSLQHSLSGNKHR